jgi:hypothetical protein
VISSLIEPEKQDKSSGFNSVLAEQISIKTDELAVDTVRWVSLAKVPKLDPRKELDIFKGNMVVE